MTRRHPVFKERRAIVKGFELLQQAELRLFVSVQLIQCVHFVESPCFPGPIRLSSPGYLLKTCL